MMDDLRILIFFFRFFETFLGLIETITDINLTLRYPSL